MVYPSNFCSKGYYCTFIYPSKTEAQEGTDPLEDLEPLPCALTFDTKTSQLATSSAAAILPWDFLALSQLLDLLEAELHCGWKAVCSHTGMSLCWCWHRGGGGWWSCLLFFLVLPTVDYFLHLSWTMLSSRVWSCSRICGFFGDVLLLPNKLNF